jgi:polyphenol oxidase
MDMPVPLLASNLAGANGIAHGFFTRHGGVSTGIYASLNCGAGSKDVSTAVAENRARVAAHLGASELLSAYQVHGVTALTVKEGWPAGERPRADGMVTATRGLALGVLTADCAPVLFADRHARVIGAAHAGWRGALAGILEATLEAMETLGAERLRIAAAVGPCIGRDVYEVGPDFETEFKDRDSASGRFFSRVATAERPRFDLAGYVEDRLRRSGIASATSIGGCTFSQPEDYFSYRGSQARKERDYGRQISAIVLT